MRHGLDSMAIFFFIPTTNIENEIRKSIPIGNDSFLVGILYAAFILGKKGDLLSIARINNNLSIKSWHYAGPSTKIAINYLMVHLTRCI